MVGREVWLALRPVHQEQLNVHTLRREQLHVGRERRAPEPHDPGVAHGLDHLLRGLSPGLGRGIHFFKSVNQFGVVQGDIGHP